MITAVFIYFVYLEKYMALVFRLYLQVTVTLSLGGF
jgi:hypothetical protein